MATKEVILVALPADAGYRCDLDGVRCHFLSVKNKCQYPESIKKPRDCGDQIYLTPIQHHKHALTIITWRLKK